MISFKSIEDFYEQCTTGIDFKYQDYWYSIEFDDPFRGKGKVRIHRGDEKNKMQYFSENLFSEYKDLETLVHSYKIQNRTLAEIICDENNISRSVLPVSRSYKIVEDLFEQKEKSEDEVQSIIKNALSKCGN